MLTAISVDEARDVFGAAPELAERLRACAARWFPPPAPRRRLWFGERRSKRTSAPGVPNSADVEAVLTGRHVPNDRVGACWTLLRVWLAELGWGQTSLDVDEAGLTRLDFDLARWGLDSPHSVRALLGMDARIPLPPAPGTVVGYAKRRHVIETRDALSAVLDEASGESKTLVETLLEFLDQFDEWSEAAARAGRLSPDAFGLLEPAGGSLAATMS